MNCSLMHKNVPVAELELDEHTGVINKIFEVSAPEPLPVGVAVKNDIADRAVLNDWYNTFSEDIRNVLLGKIDKKKEFDFHSPDNTSDGCLKKRWKIMGGKRCLTKGGSMPFMQQPFNEVIATKIMQRLDIGHVPYTLVWDDGRPYSACEDFVTADTELVSAGESCRPKKGLQHIGLSALYKLL